MRHPRGRRVDNIPLFRIQNTMDENDKVFIELMFAKHTEQFQHYLGIVPEGFDRKLGIIAEGLQILAEKLERMETRID